MTDTLSNLINDNFIGARALDDIAEELKRQGYFVGPPLGRSKPGKAVRHILALAIEAVNQMDDLRYQNRDPRDQPPGDLGKVRPGN